MKIIIECHCRRLTFSDFYGIILHSEQKRSILMLTAENSCNYDDVKRAIQSCHPKMSVFQLKRLGGLENYTYLVNDSVVVRFFRRDFLENDVENLQKNIDFLQSRVPIDIPRFDIFYGEFNGQPLKMCLSPKIGGWTASAIMKHISMNDKKYVWEQIADFLHVLHDIPQAEWKHLPLKSHKEQLWLRTTSEKNLIKPFLINFSNTNKPVLLHGDLHAGNFHLDKYNRVVGIFDFDYLSYGKKVYDVFHTQTNMIDRYMMKRIYENQTGKTLSGMKRLGVLWGLYLLAELGVGPLVKNKYKQLRTHLLKWKKMH